MRFRRGETARLVVLKDPRNAKYSDAKCTIELIATSVYDVPVYGVVIERDKKKFAVMDYQLRKIPSTPEPHALTRYSPYDRLK